MKLNVPRYKQGKVTCGPSSLQQIFAYYGKKIPLKDILQNTKMFKDGVWAPYLCITADKFGFKSTLICHDVRYIDPSWFKLSKTKLTNKLKKELKYRRMRNDKRAINSLIAYLDSGGKIDYRIPSKEMLIRLLKKKIPPIIALSSTILHDCKIFNFKKNRLSEFGEPVGHFVVVSGHEHGNFIITDPHPKTKGIYKVPEDKLMYCWLYWGGWSLIIEKK